MINSLQIYLEADNLRNARNVVLENKRAAVVNTYFTIGISYVEAIDEECIVQQ